MGIGHGGKERARSEAARPTRPVTQPLLSTAFFAFVWSCAVGFAPLSSRADGDFDQFAAVGSGQYLPQFLALLPLIGHALWARRRELARLLDPLLVALLAWCLLTALGSGRVVPAIADVAKQALFLLGVAAFVVLFASERDLSARLRWSLFAILLLDLLAVGLVPSLAIHQRDDAFESGLAGAWRGLHDHKGKFGELLAVTALLFLDEWRRGRRMTDLMIAGTAFLLTIPAGSKIATAGVVLALLGSGIVRWSSTRMTGPAALAVLLPAGVCIAGLAIVALPDLLTVVLGDATLTGRTTIWRFLLDYAAVHPFFGSGFSSFFTGEDGPLFASGDPFLRHIGHAHNAYLDMLVTIGWPGTILAVGAFLLAPLARAYRRVGMDADARLWLTILFFLAIYGVTSVMFFQNQRIVGLVLPLAGFALRQKRTVPDPAVQGRQRSTFGWSGPATARRV